MTCDMIPLSTGSTAVFPLAGQTEVVGALTTDMIVAEMVVEGLWKRKRERTWGPKTFVVRGRFVVVVG